MKIFGVALGGVGAISLIYLTHKGFSGEGSSFLGNILTFGSTLAYSSFFIFSRKISLKYSPITLMKWLFLISTFILSPLLFTDLIDAQILSMPFSWTNVGLLGFILVGATFLPYLLVPVAQRFIRPTTMSMYNYIMPFIATILGVWLGQGELTLVKLLCALFIFIGVFLVTKSK